MGCSHDIILHVLEQEEELTEEEDKDKDKDKDKEDESFRVPLLGPSSQSTDPSRARGPTVPRSTCPHAQHP